MRKIINRANYVAHYSYFGDSVTDPILIRGEKFSKPSQTIPGMAVPLRTLLDRYTVNGVYTGKGFSPVYSNDPDIPDNFERMSDLDRLEAAQDLSRSISAERQMLAERKRKRERAATAAPPAPPVSNSDDQNFGPGGRDFPV